LQYSATGDATPQYQELQDRIAGYEKGGTGGVRSFQSQDYQELIRRRDEYESGFSQEEQQQQAGGGAKPS